MSSSRLPGKVLAPILGEAMIARQLERVARASVDVIVVATSSDPGDDPIAAMAGKLGIECFRGSLIDVLDRYLRAARRCRADHVVRLTADCPLTDPGIIDAVLERHLRDGNDYTSNTLRRTFPDGLDVEVLTVQSLASVWHEARAGADREHVTSYLLRHAESFRSGGVEHAVDRSAWRLTVDFAEDLELVRAIYAALYPSSPAFGYEDIVTLIESQPSLRAINAMHAPAPAVPAHADG